jgi:sulfur carrier protein
MKFYLNHRTLLYVEPELTIQFAQGTISTPLEVHMPVHLKLREAEYEVRAGMTLLAALKKINVQPESVIAVRNGELVTEDEILQEGDQIKLVAVISGGSVKTDWIQAPRSPSRGRGTR